MFVQRGDQLVALSEAPYEAETVLQELLEKYPALLAGDGPEARPWLLIRREASVRVGSPDGPRGSLDHLFVDAVGTLTLGEVKRSSDSRVRREVVGQLLDYAANAASYWDIGTLRGWFEERCGDADPDVALSDAFPDVVDSDEYWKTVQTNLVAGRLRLVFVADAIPPALRRIVEFLNSQMTQTEVIAIEVKQYRDDAGNHQIYAPRVLGQTQASRDVKDPSSGREWDRDTFLEHLMTTRGESAVKIAERLFVWVENRKDLIESFGSGAQSGSFQAGYWDDSRYLWPWVITSRGRVHVQFGPMSRRPPFADQNLREQLRDRLIAIPGNTSAGAGTSREGRECPRFRGRIAGPRSLGGPRIVAGCAAPALSGWTGSDQRQRWPARTPNPWRR